MTLLYDVVRAWRSFVKGLAVAPLKELSHMQASLGCFEHARLCVEVFMRHIKKNHSFIHLVVVRAYPDLCKRNPKTTTTTTTTSNLSRSGRGRHSSLSTNKEQRKGWLVTYLILLPHSSALFMTSLMHIWAHILWEQSRSCLSDFQTSIFSKQADKWSRKQFLFLFFCFILFLFFVFV